MRTGTARPPGKQPPREAEGDLSDLSDLSDQGDLSNLD